jgi:hypothetical protein
VRETERSWLTRDYFERHNDHFMQPFPNRNVRTIMSAQRVYEALLTCDTVGSVQTFCEIEDTFLRVCI